MATLVTGGAGFIGSALVARLLEEGERVTVLDDLSTAAPDWADRLAGNVRFVRADAADRVAVREAVDGCERIVHLASSTDIAGGFGRPALDFRGCVVTTEVVCEVAQEAGVREMWLASSGVVYGRAVARPSPEDAGPLYPESHYAAAKLAAEAILSGFANLYGWRSLIFRFGNTIGPGSDHGLVHDLVVKVLRDPRRVEILGDGEQRKPYVHVDDLVDAMLFAGRHAERAPVVTFNVGHPGTLSVRRVAELVLDGLGVDGDAVEFAFLGPGPFGGGWPGDTPLVEFDVGRLERLGWRPARAAEASVRQAAREIAARYADGRRPLVTSIERNAARRSAAYRDGSAAPGASVTAAAMAGPQTR